MEFAITGIAMILVGILIPAVWKGDGGRNPIRDEDVPTNTEGRRPLWVKFAEASPREVICATFIVMGIIFVMVYAFDWLKG